MVDVPCGGCTACCNYGLIFLAPDEDISQYETVRATNPQTGSEGDTLAHKPDGSCVYLGKSGCTIHARAPRICKEFDCRMMYLALTRQERRAAPGMHQDVLAAGRARVKTWGK